MPVYSLAIFTGAFLLFQLQPIMARFILPWYGGSPTVWTISLLFFQLGLVAGYAYAHTLVSVLRHRIRLQVSIHLSLLLLSVLLLPITPATDAKPLISGSPTAGILLLLLRTVGLPYMLLAASGPLLQYWFGQVRPGVSPYRLYALSNAGSLLGLLSYPFLFEPGLGLIDQTRFWSFAHIFYAVLAALCAWQFMHRGAGTVNAESPAGDTAANPALEIRILWVLFAATGTILLLATTNQITQDVAPVPLLWVLPLALYLMSFIITFDHSRWYVRWLWIPLAAVSIVPVVYLLNLRYEQGEISLVSQVSMYLTAMFCCLMICHGEMVRIKPAPRYLTSFYLAVASGGALGGIGVGLIAPVVYNGYWELHAGLILCAGLVLNMLWSRTASRLGKLLTVVPATIYMIALMVFLQWPVHSHSAGILNAQRNFYGVLKVFENDIGSALHQRELFHGRISHGRQLMSLESRPLPITYYSRDSGVGQFFAHYPSRSATDPKPMRIGVFGLGVGTLATYSRDADFIRFYEINPQIQQVAERYFTYLDQARGEVSIVLGDARISLENEQLDAEPLLDVLFLDAFSGDSVPVHLLTREAFELYFSRLKPEGVLMVHITNWHLDLSDPVRMLAKELGKSTLSIEHHARVPVQNYSHWVMISANEDFLETVSAQGSTTAWDREEPKPIVWTDDYSNLFRVLK
ncbi:MAG: fused MFS/spermidine synthase [Granulosicoccus sp.]|nr:fused MFS/spermidine synthase [Granulosicoccus sp.]